MWYNYYMDKNPRREKAALRDSGIYVSVVDSLRGVSPCIEKAACEYPHVGNPPQGNFLRRESPTGVSLGSCLGPGSATGAGLTLTGISGILVLPKEDEWR